MNGIIIVPGYDFTKTESTLSDGEVSFLVVLIFIVMLGAAILGGWLSARGKNRPGSKRKK